MPAYESFDLAPLKILIAGGFGAGKTTMVGSVSEIAPLTTEETISAASAPTDHLAGVEGKATTTVSMDFGRITLPNQQLVLFLFGAPGQERFWFMWEDLARGAIGAIVIADTRRLDACFDAVEYFEGLGLPLVVAVNEFEGASHRYSPEEVRDALLLPTDVPVLRFDARNHRSAREVLIALVEHAHRLYSAVGTP